MQFFCEIRLTISMIFPYFRQSLANHIAHPF